MTRRSTLGTLVADAAFPLYGIPPEAWDGPALIGTVRRREHVESLMLVYLDMIDERSMGIAVSSIDGALTAAGRLDPFETHLVPFIARFDDAYLTSRVKRGRFEPFRAGELTARSITLTVAGRHVGASVHAHPVLPLTLVRAPLRTVDGITDVGIAGWQLDPVEHAPSVTRIDAAFVARFDARTPDEPIDLTEDET